MLALASLAPGEHVLDLACGTGLVTLDAARSVGPHGKVLGTDLSGQMVEVARQRAVEQQLSNVTFQRMDAETLDLPDATFDVVLCALGLMYLPDPQRAVREWLRVLKPGGRVAIAVWGKRVELRLVAGVPDRRCGSRDRCVPAVLLAGRAGRAGAAVQRCGLRERAAAAHRDDPEVRATPTKPAMPRSSAARSRSRGRASTPQVRARARARYKHAIEPWRRSQGYRIPGEFVIVAGTLPLRPGG